MLAITIMSAYPKGASNSPRAAKISGGCENGKLSIMEAKKQTKILFRGAETTSPLCQSVTY
jgi:hypothetical protein